MAHHPGAITPFSENPDFDYEIRGILGQAVGGAADVGEVLAATAGIGKRDHVGWFRAWHELGQRTAAAAEAAAAPVTGSVPLLPSCGRLPTSAPRSTRSVRCRIRPN